MAPDRALFRWADALVLWLWNEWGVPWRRLTVALVMLGQTCLLANHAKVVGYGAHFWVAGIATTLAAAAVCTAVTFVPAGRLNAISLARRLGLLASALRWVQVGLLIDAIIRRDMVGMASAGALYVAFVAINTLCPTGPRKPRRRESTVLRPARAGC